MRLSSSSPIEAAADSILSHLLGCAVNHPAPAPQFISRHELTVPLAYWRQIRRDRVITNATFTGPKATEVLVFGLDCDAAI